MVIFISLRSSTGGQSLNSFFVYHDRWSAEVAGKEKTGRTVVDKGRREGILVQGWGVKRVRRAEGDHG